MSLRTHAFKRTVRRRPIKLGGKNSVIAAIRVSFPLRVALAVSASVRSGPDQAPAGWKNGAERGADIHVVVEVPDRCPASDYIVKQIIRVPITVEVGRSHQYPPTRNGGSVSAPNQCWPGQIPDRCLVSTGVKQQIIFMAVAIKICYP